MTINNAELYVQGVWDWGFLDDCFAPTRIKVTDIDGAVERNGYELIIETKRKGASVPTGQAIMFRNKVKKGHAVLIIWGRQADDLFDIEYWTLEGIVKRNGANLEFIKSLVKDWFAWANGKGPQIPESLREYLDRPLSLDEYNAACGIVRRFNVKVRHGLAGEGRFSLHIE